MTPNIKSFERVLRFVAGTLLLTWAIAGGPAWSYVGIALIFTASFGTCPLYWLLRINVKSD